MNELTVGGIISKGFSRGFKNISAIFVNLLLYILTIWVPYINIGTTIGMTTGLVIKMKNHEKIAMTEIFDPVYRENMGNYFLVIAFVFIGTIVGALFLVFPGMVISIAWSLAVYLVVENNMNPVDAIKKSNELTYGNKWTIFFGYFVIQIIYMVLFLFIDLLYSKASYMTDLYFIIKFTLVFIFNIIVLGAKSYIYGTLTYEEENL